GVTLLCRWQRDEAGRQVLRFREYCDTGAAREGLAARRGLAVALPPIRCSLAAPAGPGAALLFHRLGEGAATGQGLPPIGLVVLSLDAGFDLLLPAQRSAPFAAGRLPRSADLLGRLPAARWAEPGILGERCEIPLGGGAALSRSSPPDTVPCRSP